MAKAPTMNEWAEKIGTIALNGFVYKGRTLREWIDLMASGYCVVLPDGATNGDMIKALFGKENIYIDKFSEEVNIYKNQVYVATIKRYWWNAPYKAGDTDGNS